MGGTIQILTIESEFSVESWEAGGKD